MQITKLTRIISSIFFGITFILAIFALAAGYSDVIIDMLLILILIVAGVLPNKKIGSILYLVGFSLSLILVISELVKYPSFHYARILPLFGYLLLIVNMLFDFKEFEKKQLYSKIISGVAIVIFLILFMNDYSMYNLYDLKHSQFGTMIYFYFILNSFSFVICAVGFLLNNFDIKLPNKIADNNKVSSGGSMNYTNNVLPENTEDLSETLLNALRPKLKAPTSAILCSTDEMQITEENGLYKIEGYVNSQNSYGAMIATDFTATARYVNGQWVVVNTVVGVKNAKNYTKNFLVAFIVLSIFCAVVGFAWYFFTSLMIH